MPDPVTTVVSKMSGCVGMEHQLGRRLSVWINDHEASAGGSEDGADGRPAAELLTKSEILALLGQSA